MDMATIMMNKYKEYETLNNVIIKIRLIVLQMIQDKEVLSPILSTKLIEFINNYDHAKKQYLIAKQNYEMELIIIAKEAAEAKHRLEASKRPHRIFLPLQNGTFGIYGLPTNLKFITKW